MAPNKLHRALRRLLVPLTLVAVTVAVPAASLAQGGLTASDPTDQAILATAPTAIELTFGNAPDRDFSHVTVLDDTGLIVNSAELSSSGNLVRQPVAIDTPGDFTVAYHVEFRDGGETRGFLRFSVGTGIAPASVGGAVERAVTAALNKHRHQIDPVSAVLLVIDAAVVLGILILLLVTRPKQQTPLGGTSKWSVDI